MSTVIDRRSQSVLRNRRRPGGPGGRWHAEAGDSRASASGSAKISVEMTCGPSVLDHSDGAHEPAREPTGYRLLANKDHQVEKGRGPWGAVWSLEAGFLRSEEVLFGSWAGR